MPLTTFRLPMQKLLLTSVRTTEKLDTYVPNHAKSPTIQKIRQTRVNIDEVKTKLKRTRHFHLIFVSNILSYNFILITRLPAFSVNYQKKKRTKILKSHS